MILDKIANKIKSNRTRYLPLPDKESQNTTKSKAEEALPCQKRKNRQNTKKKRKNRKRKKKLMMITEFV